MTLLIHLLDLIGIVAFAATGAMLAGRKQMDLFGGLVLAFVTGIGGGTLRDMILDVPVFWLDKPDYIAACFIGFLVVSVSMFKYHSVNEIAIDLVDALGLAVFTVLGTHKTISLGLPASTAVMMGVLTGCGGGLLRDVLANEVPMILTRKTLYATASLAGAILLVIVHPLSAIGAIAVSFACVLVIRVGALYAGWRLPFFPK